MARTARRLEMTATDEALQQATFDFLPEELRLQQRFGSTDAADWAERRARLKVIDRQVISTGSRLAAARLREILRPDEPAADAVTNLTEADRLARQRADLRDMGAALFYFRDEPLAVAANEGDLRQQRLHPRPLPARYFA